MSRSLLDTTIVLCVSSPPSLPHCPGTIPNHHNYLTHNQLKPQKDIILHDNDADLVVLNPDWDSLLLNLKAALPGFRVFFVVPSEDTSIKWIRVMSGVGIMDLVGFFVI